MGSSAPYDTKLFTYVLDEVIVWTDLWVSVHVWAQPFSDLREIGWINFRLLEHESQGDVPLYPTSPRSRGGRGIADARAAGDDIATGFLKWDGCMEMQLDHHFCGARNVWQVTEAIRRLLVWARETYGFEKLEGA